MKVGDYVAVLDDNLEGIIKQLENDIATIEDENGFEISFHKSELVVMENNASDLSRISVPIQQILKEKESSKLKKSQGVKSKQRAEPMMVVDLHLHKLVASEKALSAYDKLNIQLETAQHKLEFAIKKRMQKIVFIHGVGEGVLKAEIETLLRRYDEVKFYDADYKTYGLGATEVYIYQNY